MQFSSLLPLGLKVFLLALAIFAGHGHAQDTYKQIYAFPATPFMDIENIAVRSNGNILFTTITGSTTYLLDPSSSSPSPQLLHTYTGANSSLGIAEVQPDVFAVVVANYSTTTFKAVKGSCAVWKLDLSKGVPGTATKVTSIPQAEELNGATAIPGTADLVLIADSGLGVIWRVNTTSGAYDQAIQSSMFAPPANATLGINGIHVRDSNLYFTNGATGVYGKVSIAANGSATGSVNKVASRLSSSLIYDDFAFDPSGTAVVANHPYTITTINSSGYQIAVINNNTAFDQPTSLALARGGQNPNCTMYVVTAGLASSTHSGQVISLNIC